MNIEQAVKEILDCRAKYGSDVSRKCTCPKCGETIKVAWEGYWVKQLTTQCYDCSFSAEFETVDNIEKALRHAGIIRGGTGKWRAGKVGISGLEKGE